ncbi:hypothetical protein PV325_004599 [Microctonus aethiopoides]|nr:hypothetical protein PV325_004599 [Microctonus aethiopoides]
MRAAVDVVDVIAAALSPLFAPTLNIRSVYKQNSHFYCVQLIYILATTASWPATLQSLQYCIASMIILAAKLREVIAVVSSSGGGKVCDGMEKEEGTRTRFPSLAREFQTALRKIAVQPTKEIAWSV